MKSRNVRDFSDFICFEISKVMMQYPETYSDKIYNAVTIYEGIEEIGQVGIRNGLELAISIIRSKVKNMTKEEAEVLKQELTTKNDLGVDCIVDVLGSYTDLDIPYKREIAENILTKLSSVTLQEPAWIPVSERLPEEEGLYLVTVKNEHDRRYSKTCYFHGDGNWFARQDVIAWMPSPASYEPKESEKKE